MCLRLTWPRCLLEAFIFCSTHPLADRLGMLLLWNAPILCTKALVGPLDVACDPDGMMLTLAWKASATTPQQLGAKCSSAWCEYRRKQGEYSYRLRVNHLPVEVGAFLEKEEGARAHNRASNHSLYLPPLQATANLVDSPVRKKAAQTIRP